MRGDGDGVDFGNDGDGGDGDGVDFGNDGDGGDGDGVDFGDAYRGEDFFGNGDEEGIESFQQEEETEEPEVLRFQDGQQEAEQQEETEEQQEDETEEPEALRFQDGQQEAEQQEETEEQQEDETEEPEALRFQDGQQEAEQQEETEEPEIFLFEEQQAVDAEGVDQEAQTETEQTATGANIRQEAQTETEQTATGANIGQEAQTETEQTATGANIGQEAQTETEQTATGANIGQEAQQQAEQQAFDADSEQKIIQTATQVATSVEDLGIEESSNVKQVIEQFAKQTATSGGDPTKFIGDLSTQIANNPKSDLVKSLGDLAGLYGSENYDRFNEAVKQSGIQTAIQTAIGTGNIDQKQWQNFYNVYGDIIIKDKDEWKKKINYDIYYDRHYDDHDRHYDDRDHDHDRDHDYHDIKIIKKIYKRDNSCPTQSDSTLLKGKILGKGVIILADFEPCELKDGRATLNIPTNPNLKFVVLSIDKKGNDHDGAIVTKQKIQSLSKNTGLYVVNFDDKMTGIDPVTGKKKTLDEINGLALYNTATKSLDFKSGNSLALTAVLKK